MASMAPHLFDMFRSAVDSGRRGTMTTPNIRRSRVATLVAAAFPLAAVGILAPQAVTDAFTASGYMPHGHCYLWQPRLLALHGISDLLIGIAYLAISLTLAYLVYRARDHIPFHWMVLAFVHLRCALSGHVLVVVLPERRPRDAGLLL
jgi:hypothetical protein